MEKPLSRNHRQTTAKMRSRRKGDFKSHDPRSGKGGKRKGAGRKSNETREINRIAAEIARDYIENTVKQLMETYLGLAAGVVVKRNGKEFKLVVDPATTRDAVAKLLPAARQEFDIQTHGAVTVITNVDPHAGRKR
ncbi:MAG: hypothetical protein IH857_00695 [Deltaproteobacteria bacterium]|nr:hypothetical protein [Deltaproteobacteria bacterium]